MDGKAYGWCRYFDIDGKCFEGNFKKGFLSGFIIQKKLRDDCKKGTFKNGLFIENMEWEITVSNHRKNEKGILIDLLTN